MDEIAALIESSLGAPKGKRIVEIIVGGDTHSTFKVTDDSQSVFVKACRADEYALLQAEFNSLEKIIRLGINYYPRPHQLMANDNFAILILAFHRLGSVDAESAAQLGQILAHQHSINSEQFGWSSDNYLGRSLQVNRHCDTWLEFFQVHRLEPQLGRAKSNGLSNRIVTAVEQAIDRWPSLAVDAINPCLLHGDLWSGNVAFDVQSAKPLLYDPAPYFGDPEADIAMTELFGRFPDSFYSAYHEIIPKRSGYDERKKILNLYHALNHFNLFGPSYEPLLSECCP